MNTKRWMQIAFINLLVVAAIGIVLRYKIAFSLPCIDQKYLLHAHSHFAFAGWVSQALMALIVSRLSADLEINLFKRYGTLLWANLLSAYGMLLSFPFEGYGIFSISFSTVSVIVSCIYCYFVWTDINKTKHKKVSHLWIKAATLFNVISAVGAIGLSALMILHINHQNYYLAAVYFFLHFQYNGWFQFTVLGLLFGILETTHSNAPSFKTIFGLFALSCIPIFFLSALWLPIPTIVYTIVVIAAIAQMAGWLMTIKIFINQRKALKSTIHKVPYAIITLSMLALSIKILLQLASTIPSLSTLTFGFRPIVIGYLHLVLLGVITLFILGYTINANILSESGIRKAGIVIFIAGIILNEIALMIQGATALGYNTLPYINEALLTIAIAMFIGLFMINLPVRNQVTLK